MALSFGVQSVSPRASSKDARRSGFRSFAAALDKVRHAPVKKAVLLLTASRSLFVKCDLILRLGKVPEDRPRG
jgi:hypothetical protein